MDKYILLRRKNPADAELRSKITTKIPLFEKAINKLKEKKSLLTFTGQNSSSNSFTNNKGEFAFAINSTTMNEYSQSHDLAPNISRIEERSFNNYPDMHDSFTKSVKTLFNSIKTDTFSKHSDQGILNELRHTSYINNESFFDQKMAELECKLHGLKHEDP
jgi:hypothetical protein